MLGSIGFGLERLPLLALARARAATIVFFLILAALAFGASRLSFDEDLRNVFAGSTRAFQAYTEEGGNFTDPENEILVLVEGQNLGHQTEFRRLTELQLELQLIDGVDSVYSLFALRDPPNADGDSPLVVSDAGGLTPELAERIRGDPVLGSKLLSADGSAMIFMVTPAESGISVAASETLAAAIHELAGKLLGGLDLKVTVTGFPVIRAGIVEVIKRDQVVLNVAGALIGFVVSLLVFRSVIGALLTAVPAILGGLAVIGLMGLLGIPVTVMSNVVPVLVLILGYVDGMHLTHSFRQHRDAGEAVPAAERLAQQEVGAACVLAALTTAIAFLSLLIADTKIVRDLGVIGTLGVMLGSAVSLVAHALLTLAIGRFWRTDLSPRPDVLTHLAGPSGALTRLAVDHARPVFIASLGMFAAFIILHFSVPPEHSIREHLPKDHAANAALGRIDRMFNGIFPVEIVLQSRGLMPISPEALERIGAVHRAVEAVPGAGAPLSLWSLVEWLDGRADNSTAQRLGSLMDDLSPATRSRFLGKTGEALVSVSIRDMPSSETEMLIASIERAARASGGEDVIVTGATVLTTRGAVDTISNLNLSLILSVLANVGVIMLAFRNAPIGVVSFLPNIIPIVGVGTVLFFLGRGMQMTSVIALTVGFGIAVDNTIHYINRFHMLRKRGRSLRDRLIQTSRQIGPVMFGTTMVIIAGLTTTLTSGLPTVALFGVIMAATLAGALLSSLIVLPALIAGYGKRWFKRGGDGEVVLADGPLETPR